MHEDEDRLGAEAHPRDPLHRLDNAAANEIMIKLCLGLEGFYGMKDLFSVKKNVHWNTLQSVERSLLR